jgi:hypothetical protein
MGEVFLRGPGIKKGKPHYCWIIWSPGQAAAFKPCESCDGEGFHRSPTRTVFVHGLGDMVIGGVHTCGACRGQRSTLHYLNRGKCLPPLVKRKRSWFARATRQGGGEQ